MLGLSMTQLVTMSIGSVLLLIWLIVFAISNKYAPMFQGLDEKEYPMKELYCFGYGLLELFHYSYKKQKHRDLKQQIKVKLIDFGAAKNYEMSSLQESIVLKYGYAPIEQYAKDGKQGPWTDIYALCATMYYLMSGRKIPEAKSRVKKDTIVMLSEMGVTIGKKQENAIMKGLSIWPDDRYQTMEELYNDVYM